MLNGLTDFAVVVFSLSMFKICGIFGISKIKFFNFSGAERVKQIPNKLKTIQKLVRL